MFPVNGNAKIAHVGRRFTIVPNDILDNPAISYRAKGIYAYLRSKPENWEFRMQNIINSSKEGRDAVKASIKELEDAGYLKRCPIRCPETGKFNGWIWYVYETPTNRQCDRQPGNPSVG